MGKTCSRLVLACYLMTITPYVQGQPNPVVFSGMPAFRQGMNISAYTVFYEDNSGKGLSLSEIRQKQFLPFRLKINDRASAQVRSVMVTWLNFSIKNNSTDTLELYYVCNTHSYIDVYEGDRFVIRSGHYRSVVRKELMKLVIHPMATNDYWIKIEDHYRAIEPIISVIHTRGTLSEAFAWESQRTMPLMLILGMMCGSFLFMSLFAAYAYYLNRDRVFLYYSLFAVSVFYVSVIAVNSRFGIFDIPSMTLNYLMFIFYGLFISRIIDLQRRSPASWHILIGLLFVCFLQQVLFIAEILWTGRPVFENGAYYNIEMISGIIVIIFCFALIVKFKTSVTRYLVVGVLSMICIGFIPLTLNVFFVVKNDALEAIINYPPIYALVGLAVENLCFTMALAHRSKQHELDKIQLQKNYASEIEKELILRSNEIKEQQQKLEEQRVRQLTSDFEQQLQSSEMTALRAQMNPHFIFNCLNSIKLYTLENNATAASEYLTKFSRLIRLVLDNSRSEKVLLAYELETVQLYMDMEAMRFKSKFVYQIQISEMVDVHYLEIPPMLIQPYVENAIWHGLMHKEDDGRVDIIIGQIDDGNLEIQILDDGIGRAKAEDYKSKSAMRHKSFGMKMTSDRIALINQLDRSKTTVHIEDILDSDNISRGTKVILVIPI